MVSRRRERNDFIVCDEAPETWYLVVKVHRKDGWNGDITYGELAQELMKMGGHNVISMKFLPPGWDVVAVNKCDNSQKV